MTKQLDDIIIINSLRKSNCKVCAINETIDNYSKYIKTCRSSAIKLQRQLDEWIINELNAASNIFKLGNSYFIEYFDENNDPICYTRIYGENDDNKLIAIMCWNKKEHDYEDCKDTNKVCINNLKDAKKRVADTIKNNKDLN